MNPNYVNLQQAMNSVPVQRNPFNLNQNLMGFFGGHGSGNNTDRSNSFSWNEEYAVSNFSSALSTPQGMQQQQQQQQQFFNQNLTVPSSLNTKVTL